MIGEFLKAELHSSRFRQGSLKALGMLGFDEALVEKQDYTDTLQNLDREKVLGLCRGWPNTELFTNFPQDVRWFKANLTQHELRSAYRLKSTQNMTEEERLVAATAARVMKGESVRNVDADLINTIADKIRHRCSLPPIILVGKSLDGKKVLVEGHSRSIAYALTEPADFNAQGIAAILGLSDSIDSWEYF